MGMLCTGHALYLVIKRQHILSDVETGTFKKMLILTCFQKHISKDLSIWKLRRPIAVV